MSSRSFDVDRFIEIRKRRGFSQRELSRRAGLGEHVVRRLEENPGKKCALDVLEKLAGALEVPVDAFLGGNNAAWRRATWWQADSIFPFLTEISRARMCLSLNRQGVDCYAQPHEVVEWRHEITTAKLQQRGLDAATVQEGLASAIRYADAQRAAYDDSDGRWRHCLVTDARFFSEALAYAPDWAGKFAQRLRELKRTALSFIAPDHWKSLDGVFKDLSGSPTWNKAHFVDKIAAVLRCGDEFLITYDPPTVDRLWRVAWSFVTALLPDHSPDKLTSDRCADITAGSIHRIRAMSRDDSYIKNPR